MSFDLVFFGGTGDLTWRKLMPALFQAFRHGKLPPDGRILAVARDAHDDGKYRAWLKERFLEVESPKRPSDEEFQRFAQLLHYRRMDLSQPEHYARLKQWLAERRADTVVLYLATSPHLFPLVCEQLGAAGLNEPQVRVVLEKPLGHDLQSAREINRVVGSAFSERQAFRIDHYLGKPSVQNLMALRFGNALFEPLWRRESIANIQITLAESIGVGTRGDFYDRTGALRDMIQNHALQLLTMKPVLYVANVAENGFENNPLLDAVRKLAAEEGAEVVAVCAAIEAEIAQLEEGDRAAFLADIGLDEPGLNRVIRAGYRLLGLQTYFTAGPKEVRAWTVKAGSTAPQAAGVIHTDFERGFIRAQTIAYDDFVKFGGEQGAKDAGKMRSEGKDYVVKDGDVMNFLFNV